jgi:hypothetical protein
MTCPSDLYDFSDWPVSAPPDLTEWVREHLRSAFAQFGEGYWTIWSFEGPDAEWQGEVGWDTIPVRIAITPEELGKAIVGQFRHCLFSFDGEPTSISEISEGQREGLTKELTKLRQWKDAVDAALAEGERLAALPIRG